MWLLRRQRRTVDASKTRSSRANAEKSIGFQERRAIKFLLASIDKNGDGIAATNEIEAYEERAKESVSKTLELLLNVGLVASVVLTISFPASIFEINASDSSAAFFDEHVSSFRPISLKYCFPVQTPILNSTQLEYTIHLENNDIIIIIIIIIIIFVLVITITIIR